MYGYPIPQNSIRNNQFTMPNNSQRGLGLVYRAEDLQQYNSPEFLFRTFNNKPDYIEAFLALDHPTKLQFYLLL